MEDEVRGRVPEPMLQEVQSFARTAAEDGIARAALATAAHVIPTPYGERLMFTEEFLRNASSLPWRARLPVYRHGFLPRSYYLYDFETHGYDGFLSDFDERWFGINPNHPSHGFMMDKQRFHELLSERGFGDYLPTVHGTLTEGVLVGAEADFLSVLRDAGALVVKGRTGSGGSRVHVCRFDEDEYVLDGEPMSASTLQRRLAEFDGHLVTEYCDQADYAAAIYPHTPNTIRVVTMYPSDGDPFVVAAAHRFGSAATEPVDNFTQGGMSSEIAEDGRLGTAIRPMGPDTAWHERHPDTGTRIPGTVVPGWEDVRATLLSAAAALPELRYVGWDVMVTGEDEFRIIEGNSNPDLDVLQVHRPLLKDPSVRSFFEEHGVV